MADKVEEIHSVDSVHRAGWAASGKHISVSAVLEAMADGVVITDEWGTIVMYNKACERLFGYCAAEMVGASFDVLLRHPQPGMHRNGAAAAQPQVGSPPDGDFQEPQEQASQGSRKDGTSFRMGLSVGELDLDGARYTVRTIRDTEEHSRFADAEAGHAAGLARRKTELDSFVYAASHDLKAPLRAIDNLAAWIHEDLGETLQGESRENMMLLRGRIKRLEALLDDLLEFCRAGHGDSLLEVIDSEALIREQCAKLDPDGAFDLQVRATVPAFETASAPLEQVLSKLIANAIKHHGAGSGTVFFDVYDRGSFYEFFVTDDGQGFAPQFYDKVWQPFQTLRPRDQIEGSGMGLAVAKKTVESYGGTVFVESERGCGARFGFSWPKLSSWDTPGQ